MLKTIIIKRCIALTVLQNARNNQLVRHLQHITSFPHFLSKKYVTKSTATYSLTQRRLSKKLLKISKSHASMLGTTVSAILLKIFLVQRIYSFNSRIYFRFIKIITICIRINTTPPSLPPWEISITAHIVYYKCFYFVLLSITYFKFF